MDRTVRKRGREDYHSNEMQKSEIKVKKFAEDSHTILLNNEQNNSCSDSDIFQERRNTSFVSVYTDQESSVGDPLQLCSNSLDDSQTHVSSDRDISESDVEDSETRNEHESVDSKELEDIQQIKQWIIHCRISHEHANKLLKILKARLLPSIPLCVETLLQSNEPDYHNGVKNNFKNNKGQEISVPVIDVSNVHCKSDFEAFVLAQLVSHNRNMQRIENKLDNFANFFLDKKVCSSNTKNDIDFKTKYNLSLPINEKHLFKIFDERLKNDKFLQNDVCVELSKCVDKANYSISKSYLAMLRAFITKNVAMQYTASRLSKENAKDIFKSTQLYECMEGVFLTARNKTSLTTTNAELISSLSDVLSNAKKWNEKK